jgi:hypothetical protein
MSICGREYGFEVEVRMVSRDTSPDEDFARQVLAQNDVARDV